MSYKIEEIEGIGAAYAGKLRALGVKTTRVDTVKEFRTRVAANLHAKMTEVNEVKNLTTGFLR